jgi:hypothetical protein
MDTIFLYAMQSNGGKILSLGLGLLPDIPESGAG